MKTSRLHLWPQASSTALCDLCNLLAVIADGGNHAALQLNEAVGGEIVPTTTG